MMAQPSPASNQKWRLCLGKNPTTRANTRQFAFMAGLFFTLAAIAVAQQEPTEDQPHELEELGVNRYTTPSIENIFAQLDRLRPLPFDELKREPPQALSVGRERRGLLFGGMIADGFLIVEAERRNLIEPFGRSLLNEARGLGVADRVTRHSASLTELGKRGDWPAMRRELIATQADVEQAMIDLRDEKMAHLISLGGWLRGLEISAAAIEADFSSDRAQVLSQPELVDYFGEELKTLPPQIAHDPLFEAIRAGVKKMQPILDKAPEKISRSEVTAIRTEAGELNSAIRKRE